MLGSCRSLGLLAAAVASAAHHWMPDVGFDHFQYDWPLNGWRVLA
jgi:hypothetical protein